MAASPVKSKTARLSHPDRGAESAPAPAPIRSFRGSFVADPRGGGMPPPARPVLGPGGGARSPDPALGPDGGARSPAAVPPPPRGVGVGSFALDAARMISLAFFVSARERELSFQSCVGKQRKAALQGGTELLTLENLPTKKVVLATFVSVRQQSMSAGRRGGPTTGQTARNRCIRGCKRSAIVRYHDVVLVAFTFFFNQRDGGKETKDTCVRRTEVREAGELVQQQK